MEYPFIWLNQKLTFGDVFELTAEDALNGTDTPVLILHGNQDTTVGFDTVSIISQKDYITNPNVRYVVCGQPPQNDHNKLFQSVESIAYEENLNEVYGELYDRYDGEVPEAEQREFYAAADKFLTVEPDEAFMETVVSFYQEAGR